MAKISIQLIQKFKISMSVFVFGRVLALVLVLPIALVLVCIILCLHKLKPLRALTILLSTYTWLFLYFILSTFQFVLFIRFLLFHV
jgi:hypothetical protein